MNRMFAITVAGVLAALPGFATAQAQEIKIGVIYTVEGAWGSYGQKSFRGIRMSAEDINAKGGVNGAKIKLIEYDNRASPNELPNIVRRLATVDNVLAIIGPNTSGEAEIVFPIANQLKVPALGTSVAKGGILNKNRPWAFRNIMPDDQNTAPVIAEVVKEKNIKKVALIMDVKDPVSKYMGGVFWPALFDKLGVEDLTRKDPVTFQSGDPSVTAQVSKLKAMNPDAVVFSASPGDAAKIAIEIRRQGMKQQLLGSGGLFGDEFLKSGGAAVEGTITAAQFWRDNPDPKVHAYVSSVEKRTGENAVLHEAYAYDGLITVVEAIKKGGVTNQPADLEKDRDRIRQALNGIQVTGMSGVYSLKGDTGEVDRPMMKAVISGGKWTLTPIK
ncbi:MAG TPA: ABC transporter substrate-binding protein [Burkholderiales bacterium]